ncbi:MAG: hypothetical protein P9L92_17595 [Candidatus Electryonea clarkiae]|nr:hypothetical protein [Candidatus Electryonea clarkiae]MDP8287033.1 hypothetical protein [Candidatus Electryonea clarkiae]
MLRGSPFVRVINEYPVLHETWDLIGVDVSNVLLENSSDEIIALFYSTQTEVSFPTAILLFKIEDNRLILSDNFWHPGTVSYRFTVEDDRDNSKMIICYGYCNAKNLYGPYVEYYEQNGILISCVIALKFTNKDEDTALVEFFLKSTEPLEWYNVIPYKDPSHGDFSSTIQRVKKESENTMRIMLEDERNYIINISDGNQIRKKPPDELDLWKAWPIETTESN